MGRPSTEVTFMAMEPSYLVRTPAMFRPAMRPWLRASGQMAITTRWPESMSVVSATSPAA